MADYNDSGHRDHARHTGETPQNPMTRGPYALSVTLDGWGPQDNLFPIVYDAVQSNWGERPSRTVSIRCGDYFDPGDEGRHNLDAWQHRTGWCRLNLGQREYVESVFAGKTLPQILELITFEFTIDGCSRATTHQIVRTRIGAGFMQHGGRDNDWRHRGWTVPETIYRAIDLMDNTEGHSEVAELGLSHCVSNPKPLSDLLLRWHDDVLRSEPDPDLLETALCRYLELGRELYAAFVDAGIPWQDARRLLWMGTQTYIHAIYNYQALQGVIGKRGEHVMDWEINCVAQLMMRELRMKCPPIFSQYLVPLSDKIGRDAMAGLDSWTPTGKYENPHERCALCTHSKGNHRAVDPNVPDEAQVCEVCLRDPEPGGYRSSPYHIYRPMDTRDRAHRPEQNPFWVLAPSSMAGGPIEWIATNGVYPHKRVAANRKEHRL